MIFCSNGCKFHLEYLATFLIGWTPFLMSVLFVWCMGPLGPYGFLLPMASPRAQCWVLCYISFTPLRLAHSLLPLLCWVSCMLMTFRPIHTALLLTPSLLSG